MKLRNVFSILGLVLATSVFANSEKFPQISLEELKQQVDAKTVTVIDANSKDTYNEGHIPTAISFAAHKKDLETVLPKDKATLIVAYCGGPLCSAWEKAAAKAHKAGYTNIKHFKGGISGWKEAKEPVEAGKI